MSWTLPLSGSVAGGRWNVGSFVNSSKGDSSGSFATVMRGTALPGLTPVVNDAALKYMTQPRTTEYQQQLDRELRVMIYIKNTIIDPAKRRRAIAYTAIVEFIDHWQEPNGQDVIAMELLSGGDFINEAAKFVTKENSLKTVLRPVFEALCVLHDRKILHLDLKADNLAFRFKDAQGVPQQLVIVDFGFALQVRWPFEEQPTPPNMQASCPSKNMAGYFPKEIQECYCQKCKQRKECYDKRCSGCIRCKAYGVTHPQPYGSDCTECKKLLLSVLTPKADVYMLGLVLYYFATGRGHRWLTKGPKCYNVEVEESEFFRENGTTASDELKRLITQMLHPNKDERITMLEALRHPWFNHTAAEYDVPLPSALSLDSDSSLSARSLQSSPSPPGRAVAGLKGFVSNVKQRTLQRLAARTKEITKGVTEKGSLVSLNENKFKEALWYAGLDFMLMDDTGNDNNLFEKCDVNRNGIVDYKEITLLLACTGMFDRRDILEHFTFPLLDTNDDCSISKEELVAWLAVTVVSPQNSPAARGGGGGGGGGGVPAAFSSASGVGATPHALQRTSSNSLRNRPVIKDLHQVLDKLFDLIDFDRNGSITPAELEKFADMSPSVFKTECERSRMDPNLQEALEVVFSFLRIDSADFPSATGAAGGAAGGAADHADAGAGAANPNVRTETDNR